MARLPDADSDAGLQRALALQLGHVVECVGPIKVDDGVLLRAGKAGVFECVPAGNVQIVQREHLARDGVRRRQRRLIPV